MFGLWTSKLRSRVSSMDTKDLQACASSTDSGICWCRPVGAEIWFGFGLHVGNAGRGVNLREWLQRHLESDLLQSSCESACRPIRFEPVIVVTAGFAVNSSVCYQVPCDQDDPVGYCYRCLLHPAATGDAVSPGALYERSSQISVAVAGSAREPFPATLVVARTQPRPTG